MPSQGVALFKRSSSTPSKIHRRLSLSDIEWHGFKRTGSATETVPDSVLFGYFRRWLSASAPMVPFHGEKCKWEMMLARAGWLRPPPPWTEICERCKPVEKPLELVKKRK